MSDAEGLVVFCMMEEIEVCRSFVAQKKNEMLIHKCPQWCIYRKVGNWHLQMDRLVCAL